MKAITICQPYASLVVGYFDSGHFCPPRKRVENRKWSLGYRGPLLIHAGKSREWLNLDESGEYDESYDIPLRAMPFGAIVGQVDLLGAFRKPLRGDIPQAAIERWPWLAEHEHVEGPCCLVLDHPCLLSEPIPYSGLPGLFDIPQRALVGTTFEPPYRFCRVCGCSDLDACPEGCSWVEPDLCSQCVETLSAKAPR
jgi:hypothetical protein